LALALTVSRLPTLRRRRRRSRVARRRGHVAGPSTREPGGYAGEPRPPRRENALARPPPTPFAASTRSRSSATPITVPSRDGQPRGGAMHPQGGLACSEPRPGEL